MTGDLPKRLTTGIEGLDREQQLGGIPAGSTVAVVSSPLSMAYLLGYHLFETGRQTRYVSTSRRAEQVRTDVERSVTVPEGDGTAIVDVRDDLDALPGPVEAKLAELGEHANFVLDTATAIRRAEVGAEPGHLYRETVRTIQADTYDRGGVSYVYFLAPEVEHLSRGEWELIHELDGAFTVTHNRTARDVETYLHVHKLRDVDPREDAFRLDLDWQASIDSSQNIG